MNDELERLPGTESSQPFGISQSMRPQEYLENRLQKQTPDLANALLALELLQILRAVRSLPLVLRAPIVAAVNAMSEVITSGATITDALRSDLTSALRAAIDASGKPSI